MEDDELVELSDEELLVFAGLARALVRLDGRFSAAEAGCLEDLSLQLTTARASQDGEAGPYRASASTDHREPLGPETLHAWLDRAAQHYPDDGALRDAVGTVERAEARLYIHAMLHALACADMATTSELDMLDWLATEWQL